jgi:hypothetical protein
MAGSKPTEAKGMKHDPKAFAALAKKGASLWNAAKKVVPQDGGSAPNIGLADGQAGTFDAKVKEFVATKTKRQPEGSRVPIEVAAFIPKFTLVGGPHDGKTISCFQALDNETGYNILSAMLQRLGYDTAKMSEAEIPGTFDELNKEQPDCSIYVKRKDYNGSIKYQIYINSLGHSADAGDGGEIDLDALAEAADDGSHDDNEAAVEKLTELCGEAGIDENDFATWADVVKKLKELGGDESTETAEELTDDLEELGTIADDEEHALMQNARDRLEELGGELDPVLSEGDYSTWTEFATAIGEAGNVDIEAIGNAADEGDTDAQKQLNDYGKQCKPKLKEGDYSTWLEFAQAIAEAGASS